MYRSMRFARIALVVTCSFSLLLSCAWADIPANEVEKIEQAAPAKPTVEPAKHRKLLVFDLCKGFKHGSIPYIDKALQVMGEKTGAYEAVVSNDMLMFKSENLNQFDAVCFNNTTRLKFDEPLRDSLMRFVKGGKGIVGIHAATDNFYDWPEAAKMMGGQFCGHPWGGGGTWAIKIDEPDHPLTAAFKGKGFKIKDEIYRTKEPFYSRAQQLVLMSLDMSDEATRKRAEQPSDKDTGISWVKTYGKGRVFYCSLGHNNEIAWNPAILRHYLDGIQFALGDYKVDTKPRPMVSSGKGSEMEQLLAKVKTYDWGQSRLALTELSDKIKEAYGSPGKLREFEKGLMGVLESDAPYAGKQWACRKLSIIGTEQCVPTVAKMLTDEKLSDMARYALERIPGDAVDVALIANLNKARGKARIGIVNTLGERRCPVAAPMIAKLVDNEDELLACAAAAALGKIGGSEATKALAKAKDKASGKLRPVVLDAYLKCADQLVADGKKKQAYAIYKELYDPDMPAIIRTAALRGMVSVTGAGTKEK